MDFKLNYQDDEVKVFHPIVKTVLEDVINKLDKSKEIEVKHHPPIPGLTTVPDFGLKLKSSGRYIFILEVKKTPSEVHSQRNWNQSRSYIHDLSHYWEPSHSKFFCITNIETLVMFADRDGPINACVLAGIYKQASFDKESGEASDAINIFAKNIEEILKKIIKNEPPKWTDDWTPVINSFESNYLALINKLGAHDYMLRDATLYEFLRLLFYCYLKEYYALEKNTNNSYFKSLNFNSYNKDDYIRSIHNYFANVLKLDFKQVFTDFPDTKNRIFPEKITNSLIDNFQDFIKLINKHLKEAIKQNNSPEYLFNLLSSRIYQREELHNKGKIMTDHELAHMLASLSIETNDSQIIDPGSGDGALLEAAYDVILEKAPEGIESNDLHKYILSHLHGIEIDPFLAQMSTFRLLSKNFNAVNKDTYVDITIDDIFNKPDKEKYDVILMNPPFLRNDDEKAPIDNKKKMLSAIKNQGLSCFVEKASQPNLYFYFVNYVFHYLKKGGKAGIILMAKFLNNKDGKYLRNFLIDKVESIILYPRNYFKDFQVSTVLVIFSKKENIKKQISFMRIINPLIISNVGFVKDELQNSKDRFLSDYTIKNVDRDIINADDNWRLYLIDPLNKIKRIQSLSIFTKITNKFKCVSRGNSETTGGSKIIYYTSPSNPLIDLVDNVETEFKYLGLQNNKLSRGRRPFILDDESLKDNPAIYLNDNFDGHKYPGMNAYMKGAHAELKNKFKAVVNNVKRSAITPRIIIPRADRTKHAVYLNNSGKKIIISTNFAYLDNYINTRVDINENIQLKFIVAYLLSSIGQLQFEIDSNNQEGLRKIEIFMINKYSILDPDKVKTEQIKKVVKEFEKLISLNKDFSGLEGIDTVRKDLDRAITEIIFESNDFGYEDPEEMRKDFELFLLDLVDSRKN